MRYASDGWMDEQSHVEALKETVGPTPDLRQEKTTAMQMGDEDELGKAAISDLIGEEFFEANYQYHAPISRKDLQQIHEFIRATMRPQWQRGPPQNLGEPSHGKLKADQWRACMEFDIPVALAQLWSEELENGNDADSHRRQKLLESTMHLATALRWATSHRTSAKHAEEYTKNMRAYIESIRELFPDRNLLPNHRSALFVGDMLLRFGPVYGWWCFAPERVNGLLQQVNTNSKLGKSK
jgi:hypothetical protein